MMPDHTPSPAVIARAESLGEAGKQWLRSIPQIIKQLEDDWNITVGTAMTGGTHAFVAPADGKNGEQYAVKIDIPDMSEDEYMYLSTVFPSLSDMKRRRNCWPY